MSKYYQRPLRIGKHQLYGIIWLPSKAMTSEYMRSLFGETGLISKVGDVDKKSCEWCPRYLVEIREDETWYVVEDTYYCEACYMKERERLKEHREQLIDKERCMPHRLVEVAFQIENHRHFALLEPITKMRYAECVVLYDTKNRNTQANDNKFMRQLWRQLHHGE